MNTLTLSPVDYLFTGAGSQPITFAFYYHDYLDSKAMEDSLKQALKYFPLVCSQLIQVGDNEYEFSLRKDGLNFETLKSESDFKESDNIEKYITPVNSVPGQPLTRITLTQVPQGSVLAVSISHALVDGFSYFHFLSSWARICRGENFLPPSFDRTRITEKLTVAVEPVTPDKLFSDCGLFYGDKRQTLQSAQSPHERIFISDETIKDNLQEINQEKKLSFTANDVITALLWKKYLPLWNKRSDNLDTFISCPFDFRRVLTDFPKNYFGCALCFTSASIDLQGLSKALLGELALLIRNSINRIKSEQILNSLRTLENFRRQQGLAAMENIHLRHPESGMIATNLTRLPITDLNFGAGTPAGFITYAEVLNSAAILPAKRGVEIMVVHPAP
jgi:NRPS condensation-like uncharacterized protein